MCLLQVSIGGIGEVMFEKPEVFTQYYGGTLTDDAASRIAMGVARDIARKKGLAATTGMIIHGVAVHEVEDGKGHRR